MSSSTKSLTFALLALLQLEQYTCRDGKVYGGRDCKSSYTVSLQYLYNIHFCGGSILTENWILTAAHCFRHIRADQAQVVAGIDRTDRLRLSEKSLVKEVVKHEHYNSKTYEYDIALLSLKKPIRLNKRFITLKRPISTVVLAVKNSRICAIAMVMGWGKQEENKTFNPHLQCVDLQVMSRSQCIFMLGMEVIRSNMLCALGSPGADACQGDSGGPLVCGNVQVGIVSFGKGCGRPNMPGVYQRVDTNLDFIHNTINAKGRSLHQGKSSSQTVMLEPYPLYYLLIMLLVNCILFI